MLLFHMAHSLQHFDQWLAEAVVNISQTTKSTVPCSKQQHVANEFAKNLADFIWKDTDVFLNNRYI